eukprot:TRINITY_DN8183_c0_g1_i1.p1 TRINITY_DN8183_c0_g1~~TRINITY_DN8183_c0_g1_i1.p1  ORF type:complete len:319 (-),score=9.97 TRINITY_DN8183_c0_g1_i1:37-993(-)
MSDQEDLQDSSFNPEDEPFIQQSMANSSHQPFFRPITKFWFQGLLPPLAILVIIGYTYYTFGYLVCLQMYHSKDSNFEKYFGLASFIVYNLLLSLLLLSLFATSLLDPGRPPPVSRRTSVMPLCMICQGPKPDRSHHCGRCQRCVLKMDHHCPWVNNCVGWRNMKAFTLLCTYTSILCFYGVCVAIVFFCFSHDFHKSVSDDIQVLVTFILGIFVGLLISSFIANHYYLIFSNTSSLEYWRERRAAAEAVGQNGQDFVSRWCPICAPSMEHPYDRGRLYNISQVFGANPLLWWIPFPNNVGDGVVWSTRSNDQKMEVV